VGCLANINDPVVYVKEDSGRSEKIEIVIPLNTSTTRTGISYEKKSFKFANNVN